jgi:hypothetical protein
MKPFRSTELIVFAGLGALMAATRYYHFGSAYNLPDASLAVFFLAGFALSRPAYLAVLLVAAGLIDYLATAIGGVSDWCVTPAYWFLIPAYAVLWIAGRWCAARYRLDIGGVALLCGVLFAAASIAFLISNASFYLLSGYFGDMGWIEYAARVAGYFPRYVGATFGYVAAASSVPGAAAAVRALGKATRSGPLAG